MKVVALAAANTYTGSRGADFTKDPESIRLQEFKEVGLLIQTDAHQENAKTSVPLTFNVQRFKEWWHDLGD